MFVTNREKEGTSIGSKLRIKSDVEVLAGTLKAGSIVEVTGTPDERGEFQVKDLDSGQPIYLHPALSNYEKV